jgi:Rieske Fe-S protein
MMCSAGAISVGPKSVITVGNLQSVQGGNYFVGQDANGYFGIDNVCTHRQCGVSQQGAQLFCPCHGETFDAQGNPTRGIARTPLQHYALCIDASGNIALDPNAQVLPTQRYK